MARLWRDRWLELKQKDVPVVERLADAQRSEQIEQCPSSTMGCSKLNWRLSIEGGVGCIIYLYHSDRIRYLTELKL